MTQTNKIKIVKLHTGKNFGANPYRDLWRLDQSCRVISIHPGGEGRGGEWGSNSDYEPGGMREGKGTRERGQEGRE